MPLFFHVFKSIESRAFLKNWLERSSPRISLCILSTNTATMVHLSSITRTNTQGQTPASPSSPVPAQRVRRTPTAPLKLYHGEESYTTSVYGSRFAAEDLPKDEMPEVEMPKEVAYRLIKDELSLDGNPILKYYSRPGSPVVELIWLTGLALAWLRLSRLTWCVSLPLLRLELLAREKGE